MVLLLLGAVPMFVYDFNVNRVPSPHYSVLYTDRKCAITVPLTISTPSVFMSDVVDISNLDLADKVVNIELITWGGYSDISQGTLLTDSSKVALKTLRVHGTNKPGVQERLQKRFYREVLLWMRFEHSNIVPLLGYMQPLNEAPSLVSPWYINGNIIDYLSSCPNPDRYVLALDVVCGLGYLHSISVTHGDLKGENVLVDANGHASLCDFGMSQYIDDANRIAGYTTSNAQNGGTPRFMSPELLEDGPKTIASDMWAAGCLIVQIITDEIPYQRIAAKHAVYPAILRGDPPWTNRNSAISEALWDCIQTCWSIAPADRPKASEIGIYFKSPEALVTPAELKGLAFSSQLWDKQFRNSGIKFSPDGRNLAVANADGTVSIWDAGKGVLRQLQIWGQRTIMTEPNYIFHIAWSALQQYLLVRSNRFLNIFMIETGVLILSEKNKLWADFLPDGSAVAILERGGNISVRELARMENILYTINLGVGSGFLGGIALAPIKGQVIVATRSALTVYEASSTGRKPETTSAQLEECSEPIRSISVSKDGCYILVSSKALDPELWEMGVSELGRVNKELTCLCRYLSPKASRPGFQSVHFGGAEDELVLGLFEKQSIHIWDRDTAALIHSFCATPEKITWDIALRWSLTDPEDIMLAVITSSLFHPEGGLQVWSINPPRETI